MRSQQEPFALVLIKFIFYFCIASFFFTLTAWIFKYITESINPIITPEATQYKPLELAYNLWQYTPYYCAISFMISLVCYLVIRSFREGDDYE